MRPALLELRSCIKNCDKIPVFSAKANTQDTHTPNIRLIGFEKHHIHNIHGNMETMSFRTQLRAFLFKTHVPPFDPSTITWWSHGNNSFQEKVSAAYWLGGWVKVEFSPEVLQIWLYPFGIHHTPFTQPSKGGIWMPGHSLTVGDPFFLFVSLWFMIRIERKKWIS